MRVILGEKKNACVQGQTRRQPLTVLEGSPPSLSSHKHPVLKIHFPCIRSDKLLKTKLFQSWNS